MLAFLPSSEHEHKTPRLVRWTPPNSHPICLNLCMKLLWWSSCPIKWLKATLNLVVHLWRNFVNFKTFFWFEDSRGKKLGNRIAYLHSSLYSKQPLMLIRIEHFVPHYSHNLSLQAFFSWLNGDQHYCHQHQPKRQKLLIKFGIENLGLGVLNAMLLLFQIHKHNICILVNGVHEIVIICYNNINGLRFDGGSQWQLFH